MRKVHTYFCTLANVCERMSGEAFEIFFLQLHGHSCHKLQINRKYCLHPFEGKRVQILYISSHIKEGFYIERENFE